MESLHKDAAVLHSETQFCVKEMVQYRNTFSVDLYIVSKCFGLN